MSYTHDQFFKAFLEELNLPVRTAGLRSLACVSIYESSEGNERWFNPFAVTQPWPNAVPYNTFGDDMHVWRYATFDDGVQASAKLYSGDHWTDVRYALAHRWTRTPILIRFNQAYTWSNFDFVKAEFNNATTLDARRRHVLQ